MEHISLLATSIGSKELTRCIAHLVNKIITVLTKQALPLIDGYTVIETSRFGVWKVVTKLVLISGETWMTKLKFTHWEPSEAHTHRLPGTGLANVISLTWSEGSHHGMEQWKFKLKACWSQKQFRSWKSWAQKLCKLESHRLKSKLKSKIFRLDWRW